MSSECLQNRNNILHLKNILSHGGLRSSLLVVRHCRGEESASDTINFSLYFWCLSLSLSLSLSFLSLPLLTLHQTITLSLLLFLSHFFLHLSFQILFFPLYFPSCPSHLSFSLFHSFFSKISSFIHCFPSNVFIS